MQRLLYHAPENPSTESPFDRAIVQVVQGQEVSIVSPYIGVQYLHRLIGMSTSWRLISDVLEWLSATPVRERGSVYEFLKEHDGLVHHYPAIHAKTVVSRVGAYTGSANLTDAGVLRRTEFGVLLTDPDQVQEIQQWFDAIWNQTSPPPLQGVLDLIAELDQISHIAADFADLKATQLESGARRVRAKLVKILGHEPLAISARQGPSTNNGAPAPAPAPAPAADPEIAPARTITIVSSPTADPSRKIMLVRDRTPTLVTPAAPLQQGAFDLEAEVGAYVGRNALDSFTFAELHQAMRMKSPAVTRRETYFALLESCASHPRTLFSPDAVNRLVYRNGRFIQSSKELLSAALKPLDDMVAEVINSLSFEESTPRLNVSIAPGIPISTQRIVLEGMLQADLVLQMDEGLRLSPSAIWSPRLKLLEHAHSRWTTLLAQHSLKRAQGRHVEAASVPTSLPSERSTQETVGEQSQPLIEDATEPQEALIKRRNDQLDTVFSHLASMRSTFGEKTKVLMRYLKEELVRKSGLSEEDVTRLLNGTYRMYRSPFLAMDIGKDGRVDIVADLDGNPHLQDLPKTRQAIEFSPALRDLQTAPRPQQILLSVSQSKKAVRVRLETYKDADEFYLLIVHWIFTTNPTKTPSTDIQLLSMLEASGVYRDTLRRLLFDRSSKLPRLFTFLRKAKTLKLNHQQLIHYPNTLSYLRTVVWQSNKSHVWLESQEQRRTALTEQVKTNSLLQLQRKHALRDNAYATLFRFITNSIRSTERFQTKGELVKRLSQSKLEPFVVEYLLGIDQSPRRQLMQVEQGIHGLFLKTDADVLRAYDLCRMFVERELKKGAQLHPWLTAPTARPDPVPPISFSTSLSAIPQAELAPLLWDDDQHLVIDTLYAELAKLFNERPPAVLGSAEATAQFREDAIAKYLSICEARKASANRHEPVLSVEIHDGAERKVEVVIHKGYQEYIHHYPKLQRYLAKTSMKFREV